MTSGTRASTARTLATLHLTGAVPLFFRGLRPSPSQPLAEPPGFPSPHQALHGFPCWPSAGPDSICFPARQRHLEGRARFICCVPSRTTVPKTRLYTAHPSHAHFPEQHSFNKVCSVPFCWCCTIGAHCQAHGLSGPRDRG